MEVSDEKEASAEESESEEGVKDAVKEQEDVEAVDKEVQAKVKWFNSRVVILMPHLHDTDEEPSDVQRTAIGGSDT